MKRFNFDIFFNHNAEDLYLVQYMSQYLRDKSYTTFGRSVSALPDRPEDAISEDDALDSSMIVVDVITRNSADDPSVQDLSARALAASKPIIVMQFNDTPVPDPLKQCAIIQATREDVCKAADALATTIAAALKQ